MCQLIMPSKSVPFRVCVLRISTLALANILMIDCLAKNSYNEKKCTSQVDALYDCCNTFYAKNGDSAKTVSCPKANLLKIKMKQRMQDSQT